MMTTVLTSDRAAAGDDEPKSLDQTLRALAERLAPTKAAPREVLLTDLKGPTVRAFSAETTARLSDQTLDFRSYNAAHVAVIVSGTSPSATISLEGDAGGTVQTIALPDPNASQSNVTASMTFDCLVGAAFVRARLANMSGTFAVGEGFTVLVTPYIAAESPFRLYGLRNAGVLHRNGITAVDKLAVAANVTLADVATGGSLLANTTYYVNIAGGNAWGTSGQATAASQATAADASNTHVMRTTATQLTGATYYDLFCSTDTAPKWVARITETQRAAGVTVTAVGTVTGTSPGAGKVDIRVAGTGIQSSNAVFAQNNAYTPASVTAVNCRGYSRAHVLVKLALTDLRSAPSLKIAPFFANQLSTGDWLQGQLQTVNLLGAVGQSLLVDYEIDVEGSTGLVVLIDTIGGQGASVSVWVELA